jgi:hypothetical protein
VSDPNQAGRNIKNGDHDGVLCDECGEDPEAAVPLIDYSFHCVHPDT